MNAMVVFLRLVLLAATGCASAQRKAVPSNFTTRVTSISNMKSGQRKAAVRNKEVIYDRPGGLTYEEETLLLQKHNQYRAMQNSSNMRIMEWNYDLMQLAQDMADKCIYKHSDRSYRRNIGGFDQLGENLYCGNFEFPLIHPVKLWYEEIADYNYQTTGCTPNRMCGHYTQVVWHNSYALGCGYTYCDNLQNAPSIPKGWLVVCHYGPAGNYIGRRPYKKGTSCAKCDKEKFPHCIKKMCSTRPQIGSAKSSQFPRCDIIVISLTLLLSLMTTNRCSLQ